MCLIQKGLLMIGLTGSPTQFSLSVPASDVPTSQMGRSTTPCGTLHNLSGEKKKDYSPAVGRV